MEATRPNELPQPKLAHISNVFPLTDSDNMIDIEWLGSGGFNNMAEYVLTSGEAIPAYHIGK